MNLNKKCEEKLIQSKIDAEKTMYKSIEKTLTCRENYIKQEFGYFKEQNLADFKEYYQQLIMSYRLRFEQQLDDMEKKHRLKYEKIKQSFECDYKKKIDLEKTKLEEKLMLENPSSLLVPDEENVDKSDPYVKSNYKKYFKC